MVEIEHSTTPPPALIDLRNESQPPPWSSIDSGLKAEIRERLNADQSGLCAYCERKLSKDHGRIDHIIPQSKDSSLTYSYSNLCHSCHGYYKTESNEQKGPLSCDQRKGCSSLNFLEPRPGVNSYIALNIATGEISCSLPASDPRKEMADTIFNKALGLNNLYLKEARKGAIKALLKVLDPGSDPKQLIYPGDEYYWTLNEYLRPKL